jgi:hypothetical protein
MRFKKLTIVHVICPLIIGGLIYISFRSMSLIMFSWFDMTGLNTTASFIRHLAYPLKNHLPPWVYYSLPDGLWVYSFSSALLILWGEQFEKAKIWLFIPLFFGILTEIAQGLKIFPGTFDFLDLTFTTIALLLSIIIIKPKNQKNGKQVF